MTTKTLHVESGANSVMAFLQARMGSTRLPGKVLMLIQGKSILERAISRLRAVPEVAGVAVLTTQLPQDDCIVEEAQRLGALVYRGAELDVLRRFQEASQTFKPGIIIRATADNPLIDIGSVSRIVQELRMRRLDYCMEVDLPYGAATAACTAEALARTHEMATDPRHREHVTLHIKEHPEEFRISFVQAPESLRYPQVRVTVDTPDDIAFMEGLVGYLPEGNVPVPLGDYIPLAIGIFQAGEAKE